MKIKQLEFKDGVAETPFGYYQVCQFPDNTTDWWALRIYHGAAVGPEIKCKTKAEAYEWCWNDWDRLMKQCIIDEKDNTTKTIVLENVNGDKLFTGDVKMTLDGLLMECSALSKNCSKYTLHMVLR